MKYLLLFDIDGTILKMKPGVTLSLIKQIIEELTKGKRSINELPSLSGWTDLRIIRHFCNEFNYSYEKIESRINEIWECASKKYAVYSEQKYIDLLPGVEELLEYLFNSPDFELGLLTGNFKDNAFHKLKPYGLDKYFFSGAFGDDNEDRNNLPKIAIERINNYYGVNFFNTKNTLIIGDTCNDIESGTSNDIKVLAVASGSSDEESLRKMEPSEVLSGFNDFEKTIKTLYSILENNNE